MTNNRSSPARDAGAWAKQILARSGKRRRAKQIIDKGKQTRTRIQILVACKLAILAWLVQA